jgi:UDP-N-acetylmuramyl pentapeptide phosphotransferase/UDP-N-acetylglucosamine-1-phosphate transferase
VLILIPIFYALGWAAAFNLVSGLDGLSVRECLMRGWLGHEAAPVLVNRVALGCALLAYLISWIVRLWRPKDPVL